MTALTLALKAPATRLAAFGHAIAEFFAGISEGQEMARRYEELSRMSDAGLAARGLTREDLPQAIVRGRAGL
ncbi:MAG TPA: DUF1127 domain-containing protein [Xanthobacteraceae bacterium]|nr:DUF1127 domain-containing protein [Xanthobacteraceae bacterium]